MQFRIGAESIHVNIASAAQLSQVVTRHLRRREGFALATLNLDHLVKLRRDAGFRARYRAQDHVCADGNPVVWLARLAGRRIALLPGSDLIVPLSRIAVAEGRAIAFVGSNDATLRGAEAALRAAVPGVNLALRIAPPQGFDPDGAQARTILQQLEAAGIGLAFLALGAPKQETLAARGRRIAPSVGFVSIGAGLDFLAGTQRRAPRLVRRLALEWAWRLASQPGRLGRRYLDCALILPGLVREALRLRRQP